MRFFSRCHLLFWKAFLMRRNTVFFTILELIIPITLTLQIQLISDPLAINNRTVKHHTQKMIDNYFPKNADCWYTPKNSFTDKLMSKVSQKLEIPVSSEINEKKLITRHITKNRTSNIFWIIFQSTDNQLPKLLEYTIRSSEIGKIQIIDMKDEYPMDVDPYLQSGFLSLQSAIEFEFLKLWKNSEIKDIGMVIERFPLYKNNNSTFSPINRSNVSIIYYMSIIAFIFLPLSTLTTLIQEKENGFTDLLRISDINNYFLYFGWLIYLCITAVPVTIICTFLLYPIYSKYNNPIEIGIFLIFHILLMSTFMFAIGTFFTNTTKAVLTCLLCWIFMARITMEFDQFFKNQSFEIKILSLLLPHNGLLYGITALTSKIDIGKFH
ncbi:uncharacterized protein LOC127278186 [Leptopilina boulardi]|uniref:uncharacterized protein LOC127278186 n=1 Tax=Leptopilina boulardi TaxID=63433 RepID=UPI0021F5E597|nr:uncharacterized protein LOC127278186 [Leptopilina boulardi]